MRRAGASVFILIFWMALSVSFIFGVLAAFPAVSGADTLGLSTNNSSKNIYLEEESLSEVQIKSIVDTSILAGDGRVAIVDKFLRKYDSPMVGHGKDFVAAADHYELDWRLLPAIAFQESNLGKKIPRGSHNPFGWAIYTGNNSGVGFDTWPESIFTVASGMKKYYIDSGLTTPEAIAIRYTENANPSWIYAVKSAMAELSLYEN